MENKKYKLTDDYIVRGKSVLLRIVALTDFADVKEGDLGGYIEKEVNLSHAGDAWVYNNGAVSGNARVKDNASVHDYAEVSGDAIISGDACVRDYAKVCGNAVITDNSLIKGNAWVDGETTCKDYTLVEDNAGVCGDIILDGISHIYGDVKLRISPIILVNADISDTSNIVAFHGFGSRNASTVVYRNIYGGLSVKCGCFEGSLDEFKAQVRKTHRNNVYAKEYRTLVKMVKKHNFVLDDRRTIDLYRP